jgi:hypothetical protein
MSQRIKNTSINALERHNTMRPRFVIAFLTLYLITGYVLEQVGEANSLTFFESRHFFTFRSDWCLLRLLGNTQRFIFYLLLIPMRYCLGLITLWLLCHLLLLALHSLHKQAKQRYPKQTAF